MYAQGLSRHWKQGCWSTMVDGWKREEVSIQGRRLSSDEQINCRLIEDQLNMDEESIGRE